MDINIFDSLYDIFNCLMFDKFKLGNIEKSNIKYIEPKSNTVLYMEGQSSNSVIEPTELEKQTSENLYKGVSDISYWRNQFIYWQDLKNIWDRQLNNGYDYLTLSEKAKIFDAQSLNVYGENNIKEGFNDCLKNYKSSINYTVDLLIAKAKSINEDPWTFVVDNIKQNISKFEQAKSSGQVDNQLNNTEGVISDMVNATRERMFKEGLFTEAERDKFKKSFHESKK